MTQPPAESPEPRQSPRRLCDTRLQIPGLQGRERTHCSRLSHRLWRCYGSPGEEHPGLVALGNSRPWADHVCRPGPLLWVPAGDKPEASWLGGPGTWAGLSQPVASLSPGLQPNKLRALRSQRERSSCVQAANTREGTQPPGPQRVDLLPPSPSPLLDSPVWHLDSRF